MCLSLARLPAPLAQGQAEQETFHGELWLSRGELRHLKRRAEDETTLCHATRPYIDTRAGIASSCDAPRLHGFSGGKSGVCRERVAPRAPRQDDGPSGIVSDTPATPGAINGATAGPVPGNLRVSPLAIPSAAPNVTSLR